MPVTPGPPAAAADYTPGCNRAIGAVPFSSHLAFQLGVPRGQVLDKGVVRVALPQRRCAAVGPGLHGSEPGLLQAALGVILVPPHQVPQAAHGWKTICRKE